MNEVTIVTPDTTELEGGNRSVLERAIDFMIPHARAYEHAGVLLRDIKTERKVIAYKFAEPVNNAWKAHKAMVKMRNDLDEPRKRAEEIIKHKRGEYRAEQDRIARAEQERLREIARKEAEDRQLAEAAQLEKDGHQEAAEQVLDAPPPMVVVAPTFPTTVPKAEGLSVRTTWKGRVVNAKAVPDQYMLCIPNDKLIQAHARSMGAQALIPGVEFFKVETEAVKAL